MLASPAKPAERVPVVFDHMAWKTKLLFDRHDKAAIRRGSVRTNNHAARGA
jgi:hypothetical protein